MTYQFDDEIRAFLQEKLYLQNVSPRTIILYESCFKAFDGATENLDVVKDRVVQLRSRGVSPVTVNTYLRHIKCFYRWKGKEWKLPWLKEEQKILPTFNAQQLQALLSFKPKKKNEFRLYGLVCLLLDTGLRISEALRPIRESQRDWLPFRKELRHFTVGQRLLRLTCRIPSE